MGLSLINLHPGICMRKTAKSLSWLSVYIFETGTFRSDACLLYPLTAMRDIVYEVLVKAQNDSKYQGIISSKRIRL